MNVERFTRNGLARYRLHSDYDAESIAVEPKELHALLTWLQAHEQEIVNDQLANMALEAESKASKAKQVAARDWHTRALVRVLETVKKHSVEPWRERTFRPGDELEMFQWGRAGRPVDRSAWWTSYAIDSAFIVESDKVEVIRIIEEVKPESEASHG